MIRALGLLRVHSIVRTNRIDPTSLDSIWEAIRESHIRINQMLNRNVSYLNCNGFVDQENRVVKSKLFLYVVGSLPSRPEISAKVKEELKELNPRYSNYPALATPIGAVAQANDMQLSRDCLCEVRMGSPSVALPLCLFKQVQATRGKLLLDDNSPMPLEFDPNPIVVDTNGGKFRVYAGKRENVYRMEGMEEEFIDLEKAFFLTALEWSSSSQTLRVQVHFWINEYGNMMIQEASSSVDTNSRRKFCSIYSRNLRQDGKLCNVQDEASRQLQQEYQNTWKMCCTCILKNQVEGILRGYKMDVNNPEYVNALNSGYEALFAYFEQLLNMYLCLLRIQNSKPFRICKMRRRCSSEIDFDRFSDHFNSCIWVLMRRT